MSQYDAHAARVNRTNTNWSVGTAGAILTAAAFGANTKTTTLIYGAGEAGNIGQRVYQETGDAGLGAEVGLVRAVFAVGALFALLGSLVCCVIACALVCLGLDNLVNHGGSSVLVQLGLVTVLGALAYGGVRCFRTVYRENLRLKVTGMPRPAYCRHAGYVQHGDLWVRPAPGYTVADTLASFGYDPHTIEVREVG